MLNMAPGTTLITGITDARADTRTQLWGMCLGSWLRASQPPGHEQLEPILSTDFCQFLTNTLV